MATREKGQVKPNICGGINTNGLMYVGAASTELVRS